MMARMPPRRHCERSEAIQEWFRGGGLDCCVAEPVIGPRVRADPLAPRNDGQTKKPAVM
jgi:hypothetical protein